MRATAQRRRRRSSDKDARLVDSVVVPRYSAHFARFILDAIPPSARTVLDVGCGTGHVSFEVLSRLGPGSRVIAIDPDAGLIDLARQRGWEQTGKRLFFKTEPAETLSFDGGVFDAVTANLVYRHLNDQGQALREMHRVLSDSGRLLLSTPLRGTFEELTSILIEIGRAHHDEAVVSRARETFASYPTLEELLAVVEPGRWTELEHKEETMILSFRNPAELFADPLMKLIALPEWRAIAGDDALLEAERRLDVYFAGSPISTTVRVGAIIAQK